MRKLLTIFFAIAICCTAKSESVIRLKPFIQSPANNSVTITWITNVPSISYVEYGTDTTKLKKAVSLINGQMVANNYINHIKLNELEPDTKYYYRAVSQHITNYQAYKKEFGDIERTPFFSFTGSPAQGVNKDFTALIFNDLHQQVSTAKALKEAVKYINYDLVIFNGDCIDDPKNEQQVVNTISVFNDIVNASQTPVIYLRGNHEIRNAYSVKLYDILQTIAAERSYGSFSWAGSRFVLLDCGEDKPDSHPVYYGMNDFSQFRRDQLDFLNNEVSKKEFKNADFRVLVHHIPLYDKDASEDCLALWGDVLNKSNISCAINAHTHQVTYRPTGEMGNKYPVFIGGGYQTEGSCVTVLEKKGKILSVKQINSNGKVVNSLEISRVW